MTKEGIKNELRGQFKEAVNVKASVVEEGPDKMRVEFDRASEANMVTVVVRVAYERVTVTGYDGDIEDMRVTNTELFDLGVDRPEVGGVGDLDAVMTIVTMVAAALSELVVQ